MAVARAFVYIIVCVQLILPSQSNPLLWLGQLNGCSVRFAHLETNFGGKCIQKPSTFTLGKPLGKGAYGAVVEAKMEPEGTAGAASTVFKFVLEDDDTDAQDGLKRDVLVFETLQNKFSGFPFYVGSGCISLGSFTERTIVVMEKFDTDLWKFTEAKKIEDEWERKLFAVDFLIHSITMVRTLHEMGFVHRDIKPNNFLIRFNADGSIDLALIDFGLVQLPTDPPSKKLYTDLFSSLLNHHDNKKPRLSNPRDDWEGLLYIFCFLFDVDDWKSAKKPAEALSRKEKFSEYLAKKFPNDPILLNALNGMLADDNYMKWDSGANAKISFDYDQHVTNLTNAVTDLQNRRPDKKSRFYTPGSLRPNQPTLKPFVS